MAWQVHEVVLHLSSPMHIGWRKVSNLQMTRPYVTGRVLWGALTATLTRYLTKNQTPKWTQYQQVGEMVNEHLRFTYFYPALESNGTYKVCWPWKDKGAFRERFLNSYVSTAIAPTQQSASEGSLHEVEFISPRTMSTGEQVYLKGYFFQKDHSPLPWPTALKYLQLGGERGYGWGRVEPVVVRKVTTGNSIFEHALEVVDLDTDHPKVKVDANGHLLAHTEASCVKARGRVEALVGREWSTSMEKRGFGLRTVFCGVCFSPGSILESPTCFEIKEFGIWQED